MPSPTPLPSTNKLTAKELRQLMENNTQNRPGSSAPAAASTPSGQTNPSSGTQAPSATQPSSGATANPQPAPTAAGAQQAKELLNINRSNNDGFGAQQLAPTQPGTSPSAPTAKPTDGVAADGKAPEVRSEIRPADGSGATSKPPVNTVPAPGSPTAASGKVISNELTQKFLGSGSDTTSTGVKSTTGKTVTRTVIGPNGEPMTVTERKIETPKPIASAIPSTYTYYARSEEPRISASRSSSNSGSNSAADGSNKSSGNAGDAENKDANKVTISNEEALKIQAELGTSDLTSASVLSYANNLEDQLVQLQRQGAGNLSQDDFDSAQSDLKDKLGLAQSLLTRIKGTQLRILQNDPANETQTPVSLAGAALFGGTESAGFFG